MNSPAFMRRHGILALLVCLFGAQSARGFAVVWLGTNGVSATTNWSDTNNWLQVNTQNRVTPANNAANFTGATATAGPGPITLVVDGAWGTPGSGLAQSLGAFFGQTNGYHTIYIPLGKNWTLQASFVSPGVGMCVGPQPTNNTTMSTVATPGVPYTNYTTFQGAGTLNMDGVGLRVEGASIVAGNHYTILDLSKLGTLIMNNNLAGSSSNTTSNSFLLVNGAPNSQAVIYLALTNVITLIDDFRVGNLGGSSNSLPIGVYLGQSNYIYTGASNNNLLLGGTGCTDGFMRFNPALLAGPVKPMAWLTGSGGSQNVTICSNNGGVVPGYAICDLTGGSVTWAANSMQLGVSGLGNASANGVLSFDNGTINAATLTAGAQPNSGGAPGVGTVSIGTNAVMQVNGQVLLGSVTGTPANGTAGVINITGGTLAANSIVTGGGAGVVNMTNGNWTTAITGANVTNMVLTAFNGSGATNKINITALPSNLTTLPARFHLISGTLSGLSTLGLGSLPSNITFASRIYLDTTTTPGLVDLVLAGGNDLLENAGFEADAQGESTTVYGWNTYTAGSGNVLNESSTTLGNDGANYLKVYSAFTSTTNQSGIYQDNISGPGAVYAASAWAYTSASDTLSGQDSAWLEVTFRDATGNVLALYRSAIITTNAIATGAFPKGRWINLPVTNQYDPVSLVLTSHTNALVAPAGTSYARYQVYFQGDAANSAGSVYFDDLSLIQTGGGPYGNYNIVWSDEFNESSLSNVWSYDTGGGGWGDNELEYYTSRTNNVYLANGLLHLVGQYENYQGCNYTSGRIKTLNNYFFQYGRIAFRAKIPPGAGLWPGLWMVPQYSIYGPWAASGEIDVMESTGILPQNVIGTIHFGGPYPDTAQSPGPSYNYIPGTSLNNFNTYVLDWTSNAISWYIDGQKYETQTNWWSSSNTNNTEINPYPAPFNQPFYIIMNLAVGGAYGGPNIDNSAFPADLQIDYVRVYNLTAPLQLSVGRSGQKLQLTWPPNIVCHLQATTNPANPAGWTNVTGAATPYTLAPAGAVYYRLASP